MVGHFHFVLSIAAAIGFTIFGLSLLSIAVNQNFGEGAIVTVIFLASASVNLLFLLQHVVGVEGHPRRVFCSPEIFVGMANASNAAVLGLIFAFSSVGLSLVNFCSTFFRRGNFMNLQTVSAQYPC